MTAAASFGTAMSSTLPSLLLSRLLLGVGSSCTMAGSAAYMADTTSKIPWHRAKIIGFNSTVMNSAYAVGPALGGVLADLYGARTSFFVVGGAAALASGGFSLLPETLARKTVDDKPTTTSTTTTNVARPCDEQSRHERTIGPTGPNLRETGNVQARAGSLWEVYSPLLHNPDQQGVMAISFAIFSSYSALMTLMPLHALDIMGDAGSLSKVGTVFASSAVMGFVGAPLGGWLADEIGRKATILPAAGLVMAGVMSTAFLVDSYATLLPAVMLWGLGNSLTNPGLSAFAADIAKDEKTRGQALSLARQAGDVAFLFAPAGLGVLAQCTSCSVALCATALVVGASNLVFALRATDRHKSKDFARQRR